MIKAWLLVYIQVDHCEIWAV